MNKTNFIHNKYDKKKIEILEIEKQQLQDALTTEKNKNKIKKNQK